MSACVWQWPFLVGVIVGFAWVFLILHGQPTALDKFSLRAERDRAAGRPKTRAEARAAKTGSGRSPVPQPK